MSDSLKSLFNHADGKMKVSLGIFISCILLFIVSWMIMLGIGGGIAIATGVVLALVSLIFGIITGIAVGCVYVDWMG